MTVFGYHSESTSPARKRMDARAREITAARFSPVKKERCRADAEREELVEASEFKCKTCGWWVPGISCESPDKCESGSAWKALVESASDTNAIVKTQVSDAVRRECDTCLHEPVPESDHCQSCDEDYCNWTANEGEPSDG